MEHYAAKAYKGLGMEGGIARWYAKTTLRDIDQVRRLATRLTEELPGEEAFWRWLLDLVTWRSSWLANPATA